MSDLIAAKHWLEMSAGEPKNREAIGCVRVAMWKLIAHLEEQAAQTAESPAQSESSSSQATETPVEMSATLPTSLTWLSPVSPSGNLALSGLGAILDSLSSVRIHGAEQVEVMCLIRIPKGETPLSGSPSPSTEEPSPSPSGAPGTDAAGIPSQAGREPLTIRDAARDPSFVTEPENWALKVEIPPPNTQAAAPSVSSESSERKEWPMKLPKSGRSVFFHDRIVTHEQASDAVRRFVAGHFKQGMTPRFSIPVQASDDDMTLYDYIAQQEERDTPTPEPTQQDGAQSAASAEWWRVVEGEDPHTLYIKEGNRIVTTLYNRVDADHIVALHNEAVR